MPRLIRLALGIALLVGPLPHPFPAAQAQSPGDVLTKVFLGDLEGKADHVIEQAKEAGDFLIWRAAQQARTLIEAWQKTNSALLDKAFSQLDTATRQLFSNLNDTLDRVDTERQLGVADAQRLTSEWANVIGTLPMASCEPELLNYTPRVIVPNGEATIPLQMTGPRLANAGASLTNTDGSAIPLSKPLDYELLADVDRKTLNFNETTSVFKSFTLKFDPSSCGFFSSLVGYFRPAKMTSRDLTVWLLPKRLAHVTVHSHVSGQRIERESFPLDVHGAGKDKPFDVAIAVPEDLRGQGWRIDTETLLALRLEQWITPGEGDHGHCSNFRRETLSPDGFIFYMDMGHVTRWAQRKDAHQNCHLNVPVSRTVPADTDAPVSEADISWTADKKVDLPGNTTSFTADVTIFNGRSYVVTDTSHLPSGLLSITNNKTFLLIRPNPPSDF